MGGDDKVRNGVEGGAHEHRNILQKTPEKGDLVRKKVQILYRQIAIKILLESVVKKDLCA